jgi:CRP-like cAMP-binding protein
MSPELEAYLKKILKLVEFTKGQSILKEGKFFDHIYFIEKGMVRIFHMERIEVTTWFLIEGDLLVSPLSFFRGRPANENIEALCRPTGE